MFCALREVKGMDIIMKILVTGANGFIGKNIIAELNNRGYHEIYKFDLDTDKSLLIEYTKDCEFVFHLAGVDEAINENDFMDTNFGFTSVLIDLLKKHNNKAPILFASSIQAEDDHPYGKSKRAGEELLIQYSNQNGSRVLIYRLPSLFGKWSRPNYNSLVATYCYNISRGLDIQIENPNEEITLCYIDDVFDEFIRALEGNPSKNDQYCFVPKVHLINVGDLVEKIKSFKEIRNNLSIPNVNDALTKKLYSTYLSFLPEKDFCYDLRMHCDDRGALAEFIKTPEMGQISINVSKPGVSKGNHWHHTKSEKFLVVSGNGLIRFRRIGSDEIIDYYVKGDRLQVVDVPAGYVHSIINVGETDLIILMWYNESYNPEKPDTYFLKLE